jgi:hypothetical protein
MWRRKWDTEIMVHECNNFPWPFKFEMLDKLPLRSPPKYISCGICISLEEKEFIFLRNFGSPLIWWTKFLPTDQTLGIKTREKYCHVGILGGNVLRLLASIVKPQRTNYYSWPIKLLKLLESVILSTEGLGMKDPWVYK